MSSPLALQVEGLSKRFGRTQALEKVDLSLRAGEIHGLLGHNGSGKSTLIKILAGYQDADAGSVRLDGRALSLPVQPAELRSGGVRFVHQSLGMVERLTVAENLWLEQIALGTRKGLSFATMVRDAVGVLERFGLRLDPRAAVATLTAVDKANLAIVRAMIPVSERGGRPSLVVLDEPTAFLPPEDKQHLYTLVRRVADQGSAVLFVSHFLDEVLALCSSVSVLRDGRTVLSDRPAAELAVEDLMTAIVGSSSEQAVFERSEPADEVQVRVRDLCAASVAHIDLDLRRGEIVGLTGPIGSGCDEIPSALFGVAGWATGTVRVGEDSIDLRSATPAAAIAAGIGLVPADRNQHGVFGALSVDDNLNVTRLDSYARLRVLDRRRMRRDAGELARQYAVRPSRPELAVSSLSGGNAQKVLMAKWLRSEPLLLLLEEPTQGVDVGARQQIERTVLAAAARGGSVLVSSGDPDQLALLCHRVLVLSHGRVTATLQGAELTKHDIAQACLRPMPARAS